MEAEEAQDAEIVFADARFGIADEDDAAIGDIVEAAAGGIEHVAAGVGVERVHAEVAALRVERPVVGEGDDGTAAIGFDILTEAGDFEGLVIGDDGERAVVDAGGVNGDLRGDHHLLNQLGHELGCDVDVGDGFTEQRVAHAAADEAGAIGTRVVERVHHAARCGGRHPGLGVQPAHVSRRCRCRAGRRAPAWAWWG